MTSKMVSFFRRKRMVETLLLVRAKIKIAREYAAQNVQIEKAKDDYAKSVNHELSGVSAELQYWRVIESILKEIPA